MPELPEVETTRLGIAPHVEGRVITKVVLRRPDLRWPIPSEINAVLPKQRVHSITRRAKYLLLHTKRGAVLLHLGMSGSLRVLEHGTPAQKHDHVDFELDSGRLLRLTDPRRFGCVLWQAAGSTHELLSRLGPEPLSAEFEGRWLFQRTRGKRAAVKVALMDQALVVGVGNIYASEALFLAGVRPTRPATEVTAAEYKRIAASIRAVLAHSIERGGTTLRDFLAPDGAPGYFEQELRVYGRGGEPCRVCGRAIEQLVLGQRSTFFCTRCQR